MNDDRTDEKLDRIAAELRQIRYLLWFLSFVGAVALIGMLPQLLTSVFYGAVCIAAVAGVWFLATKATQIPMVRRWRSRSGVVTHDRDGR